MTFVWDDLIDAARVYKDDKHQDEDSWLTPAEWLRLFNVEYALLYPKWVRMGLIGPTPIDQQFTGDTVNLTNVLAIIGVARLEDGKYTAIESAQSRFGRAPWFDARDGRSEYWEATGAADDLTLTLHPADSSGTYVVRYITRPAYVTDTSASVDLPYGGDERLVLGVADRAGINDLTVSRKISEKIFEADAALVFLAAQRGVALKVRRAPQRVLRSERFGDVLPASPALWTYV